MGEHGEAKHSPPVTHNDAAGVVHGSMVQAGSIGGNVIVDTRTSTKRRWWGAERSPGHGRLSDVDEWTERLARRMRTLWQQEEDHRRIHDPVALPLRWRPATAELADDWTNIHRVQAGATAEPLALAGRIEQLGKVYQTIPSGRLVILGPAGAGKTVLASRLALDLLATRQLAQPVPVIVSVGSWNPETTSLNVWLAEQLIRDDPDLAAPVQRGGPTWSAALIEAGRVLPILDGFDEIDPELHQDALGRLSNPDAPMVITSRVAEYTTAVDGAEVLSAAAVVELDGLTVEDLAVYLPRTAAGRRAGMWDPLLERMRAEPHAPGPAVLCRVLANPLMVFLARTLYSDTPGHDPTEMLDTHRFPTELALQNHLLTEFVPAVYQPDRADSTRAWPAERAHQYLTYLADHLHRAGTHDLAWWQLRSTIPRWHRILIFVLVDALLAWLMFGFAAEFTNGLGTEGRRAAALAAGLAAALMAGLIELRSAGPQPTRSSVQIRSRARFITSSFLSGVVGGFVTWFMVEFASGYRFKDALAAALPFGLKVGLGSGLGICLAALLGARRIKFRSAGPQPTRTRLRIRGRARYIARAFLSGFVIGFVFGFAVGFKDEFASGHEFKDGLTTALGAEFALEFALGLAFGLMYGLDAALAAGLIELRSAGPQPTRLSVQIRSRARFITSSFLSGVVFGFAVAFIFGLNGKVATALAFGLAATSYTYGLTAPVNATDVVSVPESLARGRRNSIRRMLAFGLAFGLAARELGLPFGLAFGLAAAFVTVRATGTWINWLVLVRGWLPLTGRLPWRVQAFLTDAYERGVLRQTGAVYQFRHAQLQDRLISDTPAADG